MKKMISVLLSMMMLLAGAAAMAEGDMHVDPIVGTIEEIGDDGSYLVAELDKQDSTVLVKTTEDTLVEADWDLTVGDVVCVSYNGIMTHSLPPQITAEHIRSYSMEGKVTEVDEENNRLLIETVEAGPVYATLPGDAQAEDYKDEQVRIYTNGTMALSFPGQVHALKIEKMVVETGKVLEIGNDYFLMSWGEEQQLHVNFDLTTKVVTSFDEGDTVHVFYNGMMTRSLPGQINAIVIAKEMTAE